MWQQTTQMSPRNKLSALLSTKKQALTHEIYHNKPSQEKNYISIIRKESYHI